MLRRQTRTLASERGSRGLAGRVVVITGAGGGLGSALARQFAEAGARLALLDLAAPEALAAELSAASAVALTCDVTSAEACGAAISEVARRLGGVDVLVNNAGITHRSPFEHTQAAVFRRVMEVNLFGAVNVTRAALPHLLAANGQVVGLSSVAGFAPLLGRTGYVASKHALEGFLATLREEHAGRLSVLVVRPGFIDTGLASRALAGDGGLASHEQSACGGRMSATEAAAAIVLATAERRRTLVLTRVARMSWWLTRLAPRAYAAIMRTTQRRELERPPARTPAACPPPALAPARV